MSEPKICHSLLWQFPDSKCPSSLAQVGNRLGRKATQVLLSFQCLGLLILGALRVGFERRDVGEGEASLLSELEG